MRCFVFGVTDFHPGLRRLLLEDAEDVSWKLVAHVLCPSKCTLTLVNVPFLTFCNVFRGQSVGSASGSKRIPLSRLSINCLTKRTRFPHSLRVGSEALSGNWPWSLQRKSTPLIVPKFRLFTEGFWTKRDRGAHLKPKGSAPGTIILRSMNYDILNLQRPIFSEGSISPTCTLTISLGLFRNYFQVVNRDLGKWSKVD